MSYLELGPTPYDMPCAQLGDENYVSKAQKEVKAYLNQLNRMFPEVGNSATLYFDTKWFNHDFGRYVEVVIHYREGHSEEDVIYKIERSLPDKWDNEALIELGLVQ
jgi:asparagine synthetase A